MKSVSFESCGWGNLSAALKGRVGFAILCAALYVALIVGLAIGAAIALDCFRIRGLM